MLLCDGSGYWCERGTFWGNLRDERDIQLIGFTHVEKLIENTTSTRLSRRRPYMNTLG